MTKNEIIKKLRALSEEMKDLGTAINYYYGMNPLSANGIEMVNFGVITSKFADEMEKENAIDMLYV